MMAFPFSLRGRASTWLENLPSGSIFSWQQLSDLFTNKYFPASKTKELRTKLIAFEQKSNETLAGAWDDTRISFIVVLLMDNQSMCL